ncbi:MAG: trypsin-like serine peptidase [Actinomycetes bacterium]
MLAPSPLAAAPPDVADVDVPDPSGTATGVVRAVTSAGQRDVRGYWTAARMRAAEPAGRALSSVEVSVRLSAEAVQVRLGLRAHSSTPSAPDTPSLGGLGATADEASRAAPDTGAPWTGGGRVARTTGAVFFTMHGADLVCSGSATQSDNGAVVTTAGHCVKDGAGAWGRHWIFIPGYDDGARPYGTYAARRLTTTRAWAARGDMDHDVGMAVVSRRRGTRLTEAVGGQRIAFGQPRGGLVDAFGYPSAGSYDGGDLVHCRGPVVDDAFGGSNDQGMACDMTAGSSGGPWLGGFDGSRGTLTSVNSFGYNGLDNVMWGPYFGGSVRAMYAHAESL